MKKGPKPKAAEVADSQPKAVKWDDSLEVITRPRHKPVPQTPTPAEIEEHNLTHLPPRDWCGVCVQTRGKADPHVRVADDPKAIPRVQMDYCFLGADGSADEDGNQTSTWRMS